MTRDVCHEAHQWPLSFCPNYHNKSANSGHHPRPVLLELKSEFGRDSDTNKISEEILEGCLKYCNHREISNTKLAPIFVLCLQISLHVSRVSTCLFVYPVLVNGPHCRHVRVEELTQTNLTLSRTSMNIFTNYECLSRYNIVRG